MLDWFAPFSDEIQLHRACNLGASSIEESLAPLHTSFAPQLLVQVSDLIDVLLIEVF